MTLELFHAIVYLQTAFSAFVAVFALLYFGKRSVLIKLIGLTFLIGCISNTTALIVYKVFKLNQNILQSIYWIINFCMITLIFYHGLNKRNKNTYFFLAGIVIMFSILNLLFIQKGQINSYSNTLMAIVIIIYAVHYFYRIMIDLPTANIHQLPMFWFNSGFLVYNAGTLFLYVFTDYLVNVLNNNLLLYWGFHNILNIIMHVIVLIGLWIDLRNIKSPT